MVQRTILPETQGPLSGAKRGEVSFKPQKEGSKEVESCHTGDLMTHCLCLLRQQSTVMGDATGSWSNEGRVLEGTGSWSGARWCPCLPSPAPGPP